MSRVLVARGLTARAEDEARQAVELLANLPGARIVALSALAHAQSASHRPAEARDTARAAMDLFANTGSVDESESFVRLVHVRALEAAGDHAEARFAIVKAEARIVERADNISEPTLRSSFLENVPDNRATLALAEAWRDSTPQASGDYA